MVNSSAPIKKHPRWRLFFEGLGKRQIQAPAIHALLKDRLLERLDGLKLDPRIVLDLGSGWGQGARALHERFPNAQVIALESSRTMIEHSKKQQGWWRRQFDVIQGDIRQAPIQPHSIDLVFASGVVPYLDDPSVLLKTARTLLKPGGLLLVSTLGPDTLAQERKILALPPRALVDVQTLGSMLTQAGFNEPVLDTDWVSMQYQSTSPLIEDLQAWGFKMDAFDRGESLKERLGWMGEDGPWESTWECLFATAFAPEEGQTVRGDEGTIASVSVDRIGIRKRPS